MRASLTGTTVIFLVVLNTLVWVIPFYLVLIPKLLFRWGPLQRGIDRFYVLMGDTWVGGLRAVIHRMLPTRWLISGTDDLRPDEWTVLTVNHQSWVDPLALVYALHRRAAFPKFFMKKQLLWLPFFGQVFWALSFPTMNRYTRAYLERYPERRGQDLETTKRACRRFRYRPVTVVNFLEGTRFAAVKHATQSSPFSHLLRPRAGGVDAVIQGLGDRVDHLVDVTIVYPQDARSFWKFLSGRVDRIHVHVEKIPIPSEFFGGDYLNDSEYRDCFQTWIRSIWERKDAFIDRAVAS